MNPYEANFGNTIARLGAWGRGMLRRYRRPLFAIVAATATMAIGVSAARAPFQALVQAPVETAARYAILGAFQPAPPLLPLC